MSFEQFEIEFTKAGQVFDSAQADRVLNSVARFTDLFVLAHGWNNDKAEADQLYDQLSDSLSRVLGLDIVPGLEGRNFGVVRLLWPSKKFADEDLIPGGGAASATEENDDALTRVLEAMKRDPARLGEQGSSIVRSAVIDAAQALLPRLEADAGARREFVLHLRSLLDPAAAHPDDGTEEFFTRDPEELFQGLEGAVIAPVAAGPGGASSLTGSGGAAGLGDLVSGIKAAARRVANLSTYYEMKQRAGTVGSTGVAQLLRRLRERKPDVRLHLVGHSFGGRLVTAAAHALPSRTPAVTISLLQAAYSHNGLARRYDGSHDGAFRELLAQARASGPMIITHTKNDRAVGIAYPLASRISRQAAAALGDQNDPYGGMGRNGAQHTPEAEGQADDLHEVGIAYSFVPGKVFNLNADAFVKDHSDVKGHQIAYAILSAAGSI